MGWLNKLHDKLDNYLRRAKARSLTNRAYFLIEKGDPIRAGDLLEKAMEIDPTYAHAHSEYGNLNIQFDRDYGRAEKHIKIAIRLKPNEAKFWNNLAYTYLGKGNLRYALASVTVAQMVDPDYASAYTVEANILQAMGASKEEVGGLVEKARKLYQELGLRSDGTPLREGEPESFFARFSELG